MDTANEYLGGQTPTEYLSEKREAFEKEYAQKQKEAEQREADEEVVDLDSQ